MGKNRRKISGCSCRLCSMYQYLKNICTKHLNKANRKRGKELLLFD